jgi:predicted kinase
MSNLIALRGLPGSGKSTWAKAWVERAPERRVRVNRDDIRMELFGVWWPTADAQGTVEQKEQRVTALETERIETALKAGKSVVVDATNLNPRTFARLGKMARDTGARLAHKDFPVEMAEIYRRNEERDKPVPREVIDSMAAQYMGPNGQFILFPGDYETRPFNAPQQRRQAVGFDLDGTIVDTRKILHFVEGPKKDFDSFHRLSEFAPANEQVLQAMWDAHNAGLAVLITTARDETYRDVSQKYVDSLPAPPIENMYMREAGDKRPDYDVKRDMYDKISQHYDLVHQFDDNPQAVKAWRQKRLRVTIVPSFGYTGRAYDAVIPVQSPFGNGRCLRCGRPIAPGRLLGPDCQKIANTQGSAFANALG